MSDTEILNCPFCGGTAANKHTDHAGEYVTCTVCHIRTDGEGDPAIVIAKWNTRAGLAAAPSWIPVSERLPDHNEDVWVSFEKRGVMTVAKAYLNESKHWYAPIGEPTKFPVLAWQEVQTRPAPYTPEAR